MICANLYQFILYLCGMSKKGNHLDTFVTSSMFKDTYLKDLPEDFQWQTSAVQIYPLRFLRQHFILPLPIIRTDYNFLFYLREGHFERHIGSGLYSCEAPCLVFVSVGLVSSLLSVSENLNGYFILIEEHSMSELFNQQELLNVFMIDPILKLKTAESDWFHNICSLLHEELSGTPPNIQIGNSLTKALFGKVLHLSQNKRAIPRTQQIAIQFKQLVLTHFIKHKKISFYADRLAVSSNYLNRCVKAVFNKSCKEVILETAILHSQLLLLDASKSVAEISFELHFEDPSYFTRLFKSITGVTPSEFRFRNMHHLS